MNVVNLEFQNKFYLRLNEPSLTKCRCFSWHSVVANINKGKLVPSEHV